MRMSHDSRAAHMMRRERYPKTMPRVTPRKIGREARYDLVGKPYGYNADAHAPFIVGRQTNVN